MPEGCTPPVDVRSSELQHFASSRDWNSWTRCPHCPGLRTPSIHSACCLRVNGFAQTGEVCDLSSSGLQDINDHGTNRRGFMAKGVSQVLLEGPQKKRRAKESSKHFGVRYRPDLTKWVAEIRVAEWKSVDKKVWLGTFDTEEGAAHAVDAARKLLKCGKKRPFNFPCDRLFAYSEQIPSHLVLTDLTNDSMFKYVTLFVKKKSQEYAAEFSKQQSAEEFQYLLHGLPKLEGFSPDALQRLDITSSEESDEPSATLFDEVARPAVSDASILSDDFDSDGDMFTVNFDGSLTIEDYDEQFTSPKRVKQEPYAMDVVYTEQMATSLPTCSPNQGDPSSCFSNKDDEAWVNEYLSSCANPASPSLDWWQRSGSGEAMDTSDNFNLFEDLQEVGIPMSSDIPSTNKILQQEAPAPRAPTSEFTITMGASCDIASYVDYWPAAAPNGWALSAAAIKTMSLA